MQRIPTPIAAHILPAQLLAASCGVVDAGHTVVLGVISEMRDDDVSNHGGGAAASDRPAVDRVARKSTTSARTLSVASGRVGTGSPRTPFPDRRMAASSNQKADRLLGSEFDVFEVADPS